MVSNHRTQESSGVKLHIHEKVLSIQVLNGWIHVICLIHGWDCVHWDEFHWMNRNNYKGLLKHKKYAFYTDKPICVVDIRVLLLLSIMNLIL